MKEPESTYIRRAVLWCVILLASANLHAQTFISANLFEATSYKLKTKVVDSLTNEPVAFASVYLTHSRDTIITAFSLTDTLGKAELTKVTRGDYELHVEYLGYSPYVKSIYVRQNRELPVIKLQLDKQLLEAAKVSAVGNAVEFKQDTIIYNAAAFRSMAGDNLADLLKKMPGIEVGSNGDVKVNGKSVSKITVNGKTFFMGNNKAALDNLPATFVDKVKVNDQESEDAQFTGIKAGDKETVMDVELKAEYKKGFFGNLKVAGGTSLKGKNDNDFVVNKPLLLNASTMISAYGEKNQLTTVAGAKNVETEENYMVMSSASGGGDLNLGGEGIMSDWSVGSNLNSDQIKGMESSVALMFSQTKSEERSRRDRTTFMDGEDKLYDVSNNEGIGVLDKFNLRFEFKNKKRKKYRFEFDPHFEYKKLGETSSSISNSSFWEEERNRSESSNSSLMKLYSTDGWLHFGVADLGKKRRSITVNGNYTVKNIGGYSDERSSTYFMTGADSVLKNLHHDKDNNYYSFSGNLNYVEPIGELWAIRTTVGARYSEEKNTDDAFNADGSVNDYYSSNSNTYYTKLNGSLLAQYFKKKTTLHFGVDLNLIENKNYARTFGLDTRTGEGDWLFNFSPYLRYNISSKKMNYNVFLNGYSAQPSNANIIPTLNIINPTRISLGNVYLKPSFDYNLHLSSRGTIGRVMLNAYVSGGYDSNSKVSAIWFDSNSIRYTIPVNSRKPQLNGSVSLHINVPLNKEKTITVAYSPYVSMRSSTSYQAKGTLAGIDLNKFEYAEFMSSFWGDDASGDKFYSGESGFNESKTNSIDMANSISLDLNFERFSMRTGASFRNQRSKYSLNANANTNTWSNRFNINPQYNAPYDINMSMDFSYNMRRGFGEAYDYNYFNLKARIIKNFKSFSIGLIGDNLINNNRFASHQVTDNYVQDSYRLYMGRRVLLQFTWNFGKMNAKNANAARDASFRMMF